MINLLLVSVGVACVGIGLGLLLAIILNHFER